MVEEPRLESPVPLAVDCTTFSTQVVREPKGGGLTIGSGGPKLQFASSPQEPAEPPQSPSLLQATTELLLMQCLPGPAPWRQSFAPVPALPTRFGESSPTTSSTNASTLASITAARPGLLHGGFSSALAKEEL